MTKSQLEAKVAELQALADERRERLEKAVEVFRAQKAQIDDLTGKLCGQIRRGNLLKAKLEAASAPF